MRQRSWQEMLTRGLTEALRPGVQGWVDESMLLVEGWEELDLPAMRTSLTWWHGDQDLNEPLSAVRRLLDLLPSQPRLIVWPAAGHLTPYRKEAEILDELLARTQSSDTFRPRPIP
jgi:pimeloyl-ACP methyl ester carboxylesterase